MTIAVYSHGTPVRRANNYITRLRTEADLASSSRAALAERFAEFRAHLCGPKFTGEHDGERKDWISVADVFRWLEYVQREGE